MQTDKSQPKTKIQWKKRDDAVQGNALSEEKCFSDFLDGCIGHIKVYATYICVQAMVYLMQSQQDELYAMYPNNRQTRSEYGLISAIKASCLRLLTQDPGVCKNVCNISVAVEYWELHHGHLTL